MDALRLPPRPLRIAAASAIAAAGALLVLAVLLAISGAGLDGTFGRSANVDLLHLVRMSGLQAGLSTLLSLLAGIALAWCLNRLHFAGRTLLVGLYAAAIVTPGLVVAFGVLSIWGRNGIVNRTAEALTGAPLGNLAFGLVGILTVHTILNGAFAGRVLLARLDAIPPARLKLGQSLGLSAWARFRHLDWPALRGTLPGLTAIVFLLCFTSFPIVLLLGGGPANQTLEVAIFAAVRQSFDLAAAVRLALVQLVVCGTIILVAARFAPVPSAPGLSPTTTWRDSSLTRLLQASLLTLFTLAFVTPLVAVLADAADADFVALLQKPGFWRAFVSSLVIGTVSALLTVFLALALALGRAASARQSVRTALGAPAFTYLAMPAVVLALGFFLLVRNAGVSPGAAAPYVVVLANALLALPFAATALGPAADAIARSRGKLIRSLGLGGWRQFRAIELPLLGRDLGFVFALAFCFSLGDLGVIALFGTQGFETLPLMMYRALGSYRSNDAAGIAAVLLVLTIIAFVALPRLLGRLLDARN